MSEMAGGVFVFDGCFDAIMTIKSDAKKWRTFKAIFEYASFGVDVDESTVDAGIYRLYKAMIDGRNQKERKASETEKIKERNFEKISAYKPNFYRNEDGRKNNTKPDVEDTRQDFQALNNKNKIKNINKNKNIISSSCVAGGEKTASSVPPDPVGSTEDDEEKYIRSAKGTRKLVPRLLDVENFVAKTGVKVDPKKFFYYYQSRHWEKNGEKILDWPALVLAWDKNNVTAGVDGNKRNYTDEELNSLFCDLDRLDI